MIFYDIVIRFYFWGICMSSLFSAKAKKWITGRRGIKESLNKIGFSKDKWVWFHCASFGEFQEGKDLIERFKKQYPDIKILLTFFSSTGYELQKDYEAADHVCYLPLDTRSNAPFFLDTVKPVAAFFIRNDIWPNYISACSARKVPLFLVSFPLSADSWFLRFPVRGFYRNIFKKFTCIFVHNTNTVRLLSQAGFSNAAISTGNSRVDRMINVSKEDFNNEQVKSFIAGKFCFIAGSTLNKDRKIFLDAFIDHKDEDIKWIIVPHEINKHEINEAKKLIGKDMVCYTEFESYKGVAKLLWIDHVGMLSRIYKYVSISLIGGGYDPEGIHSIIEPAVFGCPVCFGPVHRGYGEALDMLNLGTAAIVRNKEELWGFIFKYKSNPELLEIHRELKMNYITREAGATDKILHYLADKKYFS